MTLNAEDYESVHRAGRELHSRGWRRVHTLNEMFAAWAQVIEQIEEGFDVTFIEEFRNDVACRTWLAEAWPILTETIRSIRGTELADLDARYRAATIEVDAPTDTRWWLARWPRRVSGVQYPDRRGDIINALTVLATISPATVREWPGLTDAVRWLVDDTGWDLSTKRGTGYTPAAAIGYLLRDDTEAAAIDAVLAPLLAILTDLGPAARDRAYLTHARWPEVVASAGAAYASLAAEANG